MNKLSVFSLDWSLVAPVLVLVSLSLTAIFSIDIELFKNQMVFFVLSVFAFLFFSLTNYKILQYYSREIYIISIVLLLLVLFVGVESRGAVRWFELFGFRIQFSELIKPFFAVTLSSLLVKRDNTSITSFILGAFFVAPIAILIYLQPDLGNAIIFILTAILSFVFFGFPFRYFLTAFVLIVTSMPIAWNFLHQYQKQRVLSFLNPSDPLGFSYNAIQSSIAVGSGMLIGRGFGQGTQSGLRFLPERHTDFIYATLAESLGFFGAIVVILCFSFLLYRIYVIYSRAGDPFSKLFCVVAFFLILSQFFINIGMNVGILPIVGIALPFVSYGGSSLLSNFILLGLLTSISRDVGKNKALEIR